MTKLIIKTSLKEILEDIKKECYICDRDYKQDVEAICDRLNYYQTLISKNKILVDKTK